jgi:energy-coupling factor transporter ATP-binding protein EcfA2
MENFYKLKQTIMGATKDGFLFYKHIIPELRINNNNTNCKSVRNPFYNDSKPSLSIYYWNDRWWFKDFGDETYSGDVFDFAAFKYGIDPIKESDLLLTAMMDEVANFGKATIDSWVQPNILDKESTVIKVKFDDRGSKDFTQDEIGYWGQYGIDGGTLDLYNVVAVDSYRTTQDDDMLPITQNRPAGKMWFAYKGGNYAKMYCPEPKRFWYAGQKPTNYIFGTPIDFYPEMQEVILTGGEKDTLTLIAHGFNAITLSSETADMPSKLLKDLYKSQMRITGILYDLDDTGVRRAKELSKKLKCSAITLPQSLIEQGGKDVSDFFRLGGTKEQLQEIIAAAEPYVDTILSTERKSVRTASQRMEDAKNMPEIQKMFDVFLHSGELAILFGDTGIGKSILAVAIADAVSRGVGLLTLENQSEACNVIYHDFELSDKQFQKRYSDNNGTMHQFSNNLYTDNVDFTELVVDRNNRFEQVLMEKIKMDIIDVDAKLIIIDNITFLSAQTSSDVQVAMELMKLLKQLKTELGVTIIVLAHTPKRNPSNPLIINDLAGSKQLSNFADTVFAVGVSSADSGYRYIKQVKPSRSGELKYDASNVLKCELLRDEADETLLTFKFIAFCNEAPLLAEELDEEALKAQALKLRNGGKGATIREIARELGISKSKVGRWLQ